MSDAAPSLALTREALLDIRSFVAEETANPGAGLHYAVSQVRILDYIDLKIAALGTRPEPWDGDAQHYRSPNGVHLGALRTAWNTDPDRSPVYADDDDDRHLYEALHDPDEGAH